jgi:hypothetical protein
MIPSRITPLEGRTRTKIPWVVREPPPTERSWRLYGALCLALV